MKINLKTRIDKLESIRNAGKDTCIIWPDNEGGWYTDIEEKERLTFDTLQEVESYAESFDYSILVEWVE